jgi:Cytochrome P460
VAIRNGFISGHAADVGVDRFLCEVPEGSKVAKIEWTSKRNPESPYFVMVPDTLKSVSFIEKDTNRLPDTNGWVYAQFLYDSASDTFTPNGSDAKCGYAPFDGGGKRLHFHCVPKEVNGDRLSSPLDVGVRFRHLAKHRGMSD